MILKRGRHRPRSPQAFVWRLNWGSHEDHCPPRSSLIQESCTSTWHCRKFPWVVDLKASLDQTTRTTRTVFLCQKRKRKDSGRHVPCRARSFQDIASLSSLRDFIKNCCSLNTPKISPLWWSALQAGAEGMVGATRRKHVSGFCRYFVLL